MVRVNCEVLWLERSLGGRNRGAAYQWREGVPRPKGNHEAEPRKEEDAAVDIDDVEEGDGPRFSVDRVDLRGRIEVGELEAHDEGCCRVSGCGLCGSREVLLR